jgi:hypothetical protein
MPPQPDPGAARPISSGRLLVESEAAGCTQSYKDDKTVEDSKKLRELAGWYRTFAERTGNPTIWELRLRTAEDLEEAAARIERRAPPMTDAELA